MYKLFGVLLPAAVFCLVSPPSYGQAQGADSGSGTAAPPEEHVRHIRAHKRSDLASDTDQKKETPSPSQVVAKQVEGGSAKARKFPQAKLPKTKLQAKTVKSKVAVEKATVSRPATPSEARSPKPSGFFEELFNQD